MEAIYLPAAQRDVFGKKVKTLRKSGLIPLHLYGKGMPSRSLHGNSQEVAKAISRVGQHMPLNLQLEDSSEPELVFVREVQYHPVTNQILHVDLVRVDVSQAITGEVPISLSGESPAVRSQSRSLQHIGHQCHQQLMPRTNHQPRRSHFQPTIQRSQPAKRHFRTRLQDE